MYTLFAGAALLLSGIVFAQTPPVAGGGCTPAAHTFCVLTTADSGTGSLRQAILDANTANGDNTIGFNISTDPVTPTPQTITLASQLPAIDANGNMKSLVIDGYSQPGSVLNTNTPDQGGLNTKLMIEIVGGGTYGFFYNCCGNTYFLTLTFQGLNIHDLLYPIAGQTYAFKPYAQFNIYGCFIGTKIDGTALSAASSQQGIRIEYDSAQIGGIQPWQRNLISGNGYAGVAAGAPNATVIIEGNLIGTDITGTLAIPNSSPGLNLSGNLPGLRVGCAGAGCTASGHPSRNVISGNSAYGMLMSDSTYPGYTYGGAQIKGNYIGTDWTGTKPLPNGTNANTNSCPNYCGGIQIQGGASGPALIIGGFNAGEANLIAHNNGPGIWAHDNGYPNISASFDNQANVIHNNGGTDIAFTENGWIPNDAGDADTGANNKQNYPVIQSASVSGTPGNLTLNVTYSVDSATTNSTYPLRIDFYVDVDEGSGEFLVSDTYTSASAQALRTVSLLLLPDVQTLAGFVASATDVNGYTSEFSPSYVFDRIFADRFEGH